MYATYFIADYLFHCQAEGGMKIVLLMRVAIFAGIVAGLFNVNLGIAVLIVGGLAVLALAVSGMRPRN
jgi:hypothetical protein